MEKGIDYSNGMSNHDNKFHYGVIPFNEVMQVWSDESEPYYIIHCSNCGYEFKKQNPTRCPICHTYINDDMDISDPVSFFIKNKEYLAEQSFDDPDIFILKSPYYTTCQFCSPCAPGAGYILNTVDNGIKTYCFGHDFFESGKAPYPVYSVKTGKLV